MSLGEISFELLCATHTKTHANLNMYSQIHNMGLTLEAHGLMYKSLQSLLRSKSDALHPVQSAVRKGQSLSEELGVNEGE